MRGSVPADDAACSHYIGYWWWRHSLLWLFRGIVHGVALCVARSPGTGARYKKRRPNERRKQIERRFSRKFLCDVVVLTTKQIGGVYIYYIVAYMRLPGGKLRGRRLRVCWTKDNRDGGRSELDWIVVRFAWWSWTSILGNMVLRGWGVGSPSSFRETAHFGWHLKGEYAQYLPNR